MFVSRDFEIPLLYGDDYHARRLTIRDVYLDFIAWQSSIDIIKELRGGEVWPSINVTFEDNLKQLGWHEMEFEFKTSFAFTVMNNDESECLGCIYMYPIDFDSPENSPLIKPGDECEISWWVTRKAYENGLYEKMSKDIKIWLRDKWPMQKIAFTNRKLPEEFNIW